MGDYNTEDRIMALEDELQRLSEEMDFIDQEIKDKDNLYYEYDLEYWGDLKKKYDNAYYELQQLIADDERT
jgi:hypothetical protein